MLTFFSVKGISSKFRAGLRFQNICILYTCLFTGQNTVNWWFIVNRLGVLLWAFLFQGEEFGVYKKYVDDVLTPNGKDRLNTLIQREDISETLKVSGDPQELFFKWTVLILRTSVVKG